MKDLRAYIGIRRQELLALVQPARAQIADLQAKIAGYERELSELEHAAKAIGMVNGLQKTRQSKPRTTPTIKDAVLQVLRDRPEGLVALDILREINDRFELGIKRPSLSPQLTRLKRAGKITNDGMVWQFVPTNDEG